MVSFSPVLMAATALLAATSASAWHLRMYAGPPLSMPIVNMQNDMMTTDRCFNMRPPANNRATHYNYVAGRSPRNYPSCRLRIYGAFNCAGPPFVDTWQDVDTHRFMLPVCPPGPPHRACIVGGQKCDW